MKKISLLVIFCLSTFMGIAWTYNVPTISEIKRMHPKNILAKAEEFYQANDLEKAYPYYLALSQTKMSLKPELYYKLGKAALAAGELDIAEENLAKVLNKNSKFPLVSYEYGSVLKRMGDYNKAIDVFTQYVKLHKDEYHNDYVDIAKRHINACHRAVEAKAKATPGYMVDNLGTSFNNNGSLRSLTNIGKNGIRLVEFQDAKGTCIKKVMPSMEVVPLKGSVGNPIFNSSSPYIAPDGETVLFTQQEITTTGDLEYKIFKGQLTTEGEVENIERLGPTINRAGSSSLYPTVGYTEHGQEILYFASTIPGGNGGYDLWYSIKTVDGEYTRPYNLGSRVNSGDDEITPFYYQEAQELYFSSNKPESFGGFDVYKMTGEKRFWRESMPKQLESPINSHANDYHFVIDDNGRGYFASDRTSEHAKGKDKVFHFTQQMHAQSLQDQNQGSKK